MYYYHENGMEHNTHTGISEAPLIPETSVPITSLITTGAPLCSSPTHFLVPANRRNHN
jgi:hypothetical protein